MTLTGWGRSTTGTIRMADLEISSGCWTADTGSPIAFLQWRALVARAAGYEMEIQETPEGFRYEAPVLDWESISLENALGNWETSPDDPLLVLLAHMSHEGEIEPADAGAVAERLSGLLDSGAMAAASYAAPDSIAAHVERMRTEQMIEGLRNAARIKQVVFFSITED